MLDIALLGRFEVHHNDERLVIPTRNAQALLAFLLLTAGQTHRRERLAGLLWPDSLEESARSNLRHELWRLRKALGAAGPDYLLSSDLTLSFNSQSDFRLDTRILETAPVEGSSIDALLAAVSVYGGELLPGFYHEWVLAERRRLQVAFETRMVYLLDLLQAEARWNEVIELSTRWITLGELPEPAYRALMNAYAESGDMAKAAVTYERFGHELKKELGTQPSTQTQALYRQIEARNEPGAATMPRTPHQSLTGSLGARSVRSNLPKPLTSFIGRLGEIDHVRQLVSGSRLVAIAGAGGVGKTRLAIQAAGSLSEDFPDGIYWIELAPLSEVGTEMRSILSEENLVVQAIANALHVNEITNRSLQDSIDEHARNRRLLLILDNCEHLIAACAKIVERLLNETVETKILTTSREPLGVPGEKVWFLPPLSLPAARQLSDPDNVAKSEAVRLFIERAADFLPDGHTMESDLLTIAQICVRLDGIPLAIELAAARMNMLRAEEILSRLNSRFNLLTGGRRTVLPRHQTLHAAIDWSYSLLSEPEQILFRRLSIFAGSLTLEAAETVCKGEGLSKESILTLLGNLVDKSLLQVDQGQRSPGTRTRYRMLDTICTFGQIKLEESGDMPLLRENHARYYVNLAESTEPHLYFQHQTPWFKLLEAEYDNLRAAIDWSVENDHSEIALRLVATLTWFWFSYSSIREGANVTLKVLALPSAAAPTIHRARALNSASYLLYMLDDVIQARPQVEEAISILRTAEDAGHFAWALQLRGLVLGLGGDYTAADQAMKEGMEMSRHIGDHRSNLTLALWGDIFTRQGDRVMARQAYENSTDLLRSLGNHNFMAYPIRRAGYLAMEAEELSEARRHFLESLTINLEVDDRRGITACLISMAALALHVNQPLIAARLYGAVEKLMESLTILMPLDQLELERVRAGLRTTLDEQTLVEVIGQGWELSEEQAVELVMQTIGNENHANN